MLSPMRYVYFAAVVALLLWSAGMRSAQADTDLQFVETKDLRVLYYAPAEQFLVEPVVQSLTASLERQRQLFRSTGSEPMVVLLRDFADVSSAAVAVTPRNRVFMDVAPQTDPYEYTTAGDLRAALSAHATMSVRTLDQSNPTIDAYRHAFLGKVDVDSHHPETLLYHYLTVPRTNTPLWYREGSAVFAETWLMGGVGRAQGGYDEMVFRGLVADGAPLYDPLGLVSKDTEVNFQTGADAYLYGTRFMNYLALTYGPQALVSWWSLNSASERYFTDDFARVFGLPLTSAWQAWTQWEQIFQQQNLAAVRAHPLTPTTDLTTTALGTVSRTALSADGTTVYAAVQKPGQTASLVAIHTANGTVDRLHELLSPSGVKVASLAYDPASETLFYTDNNENYRSLEAFDIRTHRARLLQKDARIGDLAFDRADRSLYGIRYNNGLAMLVQVPYPYQDTHVLRIFPAGERPFDVDVSADGQWLSYVLSRPGESLAKPITEVRVLATATAGDASVAPYRSFMIPGATPEGFVFSTDGHYLYGSSYLNGVSNIYRYALDTQTVDAISNTDLGFFSPTPLDDNHLLVLRYTAQGFVPTRIAVQPTPDLAAIQLLGTQVAVAHPALLTWMQADANTVPFANQITRRGTYQPLKELRPQSLVPVLDGYKKSVGVGVSADFTDPMGFADVTVNASYTPDATLKASERAHVSVELQEGRWTVGGKWNGADVYDIAGPTRRSREGYSGYIHYDRPLAFDLPTRTDLIANVAYYGGLDALPGYQTIAAPSHQLTTLAVGLYSTTLHSSLGSVDYEAGHEWSVMAHGYGAMGDFIPSLQVEYHAGLPLPLAHSSLWLRTSAVVSEGGAQAPLSNVYLGGFGNNYIDSRLYGGAQRYRQMLSSMPGFDLNALHGRTAGKVMLEWSLPPLRFADAGTPGFYLNWARPELFASALTTNPDNPSLRQTARNLGAQIDFRLTVMHRYSITLSVGAARGFGAEGRGKSEYMLSLLVL